MTDHDSSNRPPLDGKQLGDTLEAIFNPPHPSEKFKRDILDTLEWRGYSVDLSHPDPHVLRIRVQRGTDTAVKVYSVDVTRHVLDTKESARSTYQQVIGMIDHAFAQ